MDDALKNQIIETIEETCIEELHKKYTGFMRVNTIYMVHYLMGRYGEIIEKDLKEPEEIR